MQKGFAAGIVRLETIKHALANFGLEARNELSSPDIHFLLKIRILGISHPAIDSLSDRSCGFVGSFRKSKILGGEPMFFHEAINVGSVPSHAAGCV